MNDSEIRRRLTDQCPWWRDRDKWQRDDPDIGELAQLTRLDYAPTPLRDIKPPGMYTLRGPRRVGKSVEIKRAIVALLDSGVTPRNIFFCACDEFRPQDLNRLIAVGQNMTRTLDGPRYWFLDEITAVKGWAAVIKHLRDQNTEFRAQSCVVVTGSSAGDLREATKQLAGRRGEVSDPDRLLLPMGFRDYCRITGVEQPPSSAHLRFGSAYGDGAHEVFESAFPWWSQLDDAWQNYLIVGGFPRAVSDFVAKGAVGQDFLDAMWDVARGVMIGVGGASDAELSALLDKIVAGLGSPLNATKTARQIGLSAGRQVDTLLDHLASAFLVWRCYQSGADAPRTRAQRKLYFTDPFLAHLVARRGSSSPPDLSVISEQQLGLALVRWSGNTTPHDLLLGANVMYERTRTGAEIDFVGPDLGVPFEGKYVDTGWRTPARTSQARYGRGVMATRSIFDLNGDIWAVPVGLLVWLIDPTAQPR